METEGTAGLGLTKLHKSGDAVNIGLLGAANIASNALLYPARKCNDARIYSSGSYQSVLDDPNIEAVFIPLPNSHHYEWSMKALHAGKHVLCEKPLASNAREAEEMARLAHDKGLLLVEAFHYRYHPATQAAKALLTSGRIGTLERIVSRFTLPGRKFFSKNDIRFDLSLAGGTTMDFGCYAINSIRYFVGDEPEVVSAVAELERPEIDSTMDVQLRFPNAQVDSNVHISFDRPIIPQMSIDLYGSAGRLEIRGLLAPSLYHTITLYPNNGPKQVIQQYADGRTTYSYQLEAFVAAVKAQRAGTSKRRHTSTTGVPSDADIVGFDLCPTTAWDGVKNMRVIDDIYRAAGLSVRGTNKT